MLRDLLSTCTLAALGGALLGASAVMSFRSPTPATSLMGIAGAVFIGLAAFGWAIIHNHLVSGHRS